MKLHDQNQYKEFIIDLRFHGRLLIDLFFIASKCVDLLGRLLTPCRAYGYGYEPVYRRLSAHYKVIRSIIQSLTRCFIIHQNFDSKVYLLTREQSIPLAERSSQSMEFIYEWNTVDTVYWPLFACLKCNLCQSAQFSQRPSWDTCLYQDGTIQEWISCLQNATPQVKYWYSLYSSVDQKCELPLSF